MSLCDRCQFNLHLLSLYHHHSLESWTANERQIFRIDSSAIEPRARVRRHDSTISVLIKHHYESVRESRERSQFRHVRGAPAGERRPETRSRHACVPPGGGLDLLNLPSADDVVVVVVYAVVCVARAANLVAIKRVCVCQSDRFNCLRRPVARPAATNGFFFEPVWWCASVMTRLRAFGNTRPRSLTHIFCTHAALRRRRKFLRSFSLPREIIRLCARVPATNAANAAVCVCVWTWTRSCSIERHTQQTEITSLHCGD